MITVTNTYCYYISWERIKNFFIHIDRYIMYTYTTYINLRYLFELFVNKYFLRKQKKNTSLMNLN